MILSRLSITNFGVFHGLHEFDLRPRQNGDKVLPIVLIGGKNGAGKTTILEAIRLCLYGRSSLGARVRKIDYETYIKQRFHRNANGKTDVRSARVGIVFEHVYAGEKSIYDAVRSWRIEGQTLHESVSIYKDGTALRQIAPEYWNDFLRDLIPPGVSELFFFDGEQIQALADESTEAANLESALGGLLNIDIVERLQSDLDTYFKQHKDKDELNLRAELEEIVTKLQEIEAIYQERYQDRASLEARRLSTDSKLSRLRQALISEGAQFIKDRTVIETRLAQVETELQIVNNQIRDLASGLLPFAFTPEWNRRLQMRLKSEEEAVRSRILFEFQQTRANEITSTIRKNGFRSQVVPTLSDGEWNHFLEELGGLLQPKESEMSSTIIHSVSEEQRRKLLSQIDESLTQIPSEMRGLGQKLDKLEKERSHLLAMFKQVPEDEVALPLIVEFEGLSAQSGILQEQSARLDEELHQLNYQRDQLNRDRSKTWQKLAQSGDMESRIDYAAKVQVVLEKYLERISTVKLEELEQLIKQYFNFLCRKDMVIKEVKVDPKTYAVKLYGNNRVEFPKSQLSAGEKQLYAMSLLWALRSVSGRQLPIIIDTPLGRLDSEHRIRLLTKFFPNAAHQIILLSTDTEINKDAFDVLQPNISHVYCLEFDTEKCETQVSNSYFDMSPREIVS